MGFPYTVYTVIYGVYTVYGNPMYDSGQPYTYTCTCSASTHLCCVCVVSALHLYRIFCICVVSALYLTVFALIYAVSVSASVLQLCVSVLYLCLICVVSVLHPYRLCAYLRCFCIISTHAHEQVHTHTHTHTHTTAHTLRTLPSPALALGPLCSHKQWACLRGTWAVLLSREVAPQT